MEKVMKHAPLELTENCRDLINLEGKKNVVQPKFQ